MSRCVRGSLLAGPVRERSTLLKTVLVKYYRNKNYYTLDGSNLMYRGKKVVKLSDLKKIVTKQYKTSTGIGPRRLYHQLKYVYQGISEELIKKILKKNELYQKTNVKFENKAPTRSISSKEVNEIFQIDLVDMAKNKITYKGNEYKYILSILDVFSRFVWLSPITSKHSSNVRRELNAVFNIFGYPKVIQSDQGKEFCGAVRKLLHSKDIKHIKSRPYHPQSQGKVERMYHLLKKKITFDAIQMGDIGVNWAKQMQKYARSINDTPKKCLNWKTPFQIYFGRSTKNESRTPSEHLRNASALRKEAEIAILRTVQTKQVSEMRRLKTPVFYVGQKVYVRHTVRKHKKHYVLDGTVIKTNIAKHLYKIGFRSPFTNKDEEKWYSVSDITSKCKVKRNYYIPLTRSDQCEQLFSEFGLRIMYDPPGDGNCQFASMCHQLDGIGIHRSADTLRQEVVRFMENRRILGGNDNQVSWRDCIDESPYTFLRRMANNYEYGDHLTLQAMANIFHVQIIIVATRNRATTLVSPDGSNIIRDDIPILAIGHYPEEQGKHYVSLDIDIEVLKSIVDKSTQIMWSDESRQSQIDEGIADNVDLLQQQQHKTDGNGVAELNSNVDGTEFDAGQRLIDNGVSLETEHRTDYDTGHEIIDDGDLLETEHGTGGADIHDRLLNDDFVELRRQVQIKRRAKTNDPKINDDNTEALPREIQHMIINMCLQIDPSSRFNYRK